MSWPSDLNSAKGFAETEQLIRMEAKSNLNIGEIYHIFCPNEVNSTHSILLSSL